MKSRYTIAVFVLIAIAGLFTLVPHVVGQEKKDARPVAATEAQKEAWHIRCNEPEEGEAAPEEKRGKCEIFQRLVMAETNQRVAEFAIGYPVDMDTARGVVIMPLGILLPPGVQMMIDDGEPFQFKVRYCNQGGCYAYLALNDAVINQLKKGTEAAFLFMDPSGKTVRVNMSLKGLTKALKEIQ